MRYYMNIENTSTPFMTSPIGNLTLDSDGLRRAVDEIARCHREIARCHEEIESLKAHNTELLAMLDLPF